MLKLNLITLFGQECQAWYHWRSKTHKPQNSSHGGAHRPSWERYRRCHGWAWWRRRWTHQRRTDRIWTSCGPCGSDGVSLGDLSRSSSRRCSACRSSSHATSSRQVLMGAMRHSCFLPSPKTQIAHSSLFSSSRGH